MTTITAKAAGGEWKVAGTWEPEQVPTAADDVILGAASGEVKVVGAFGKCRSIDATNYTKKLDTSSFGLEVGHSTSNGGLCVKLGAAQLSFGTSVSAWKFVSTSGSVEKITWAGKEPGSMEISSGKYEQQDAMITQGGGTRTFTILNPKAEWKTGGFEFQAARTEIQPEGIFKCGSSKIKIKGTEPGLGLVVNSGNTIFDTETSSIEFPSFPGELGFSWQSNNPCVFNELICASTGFKSLQNTSFTVAKFRLNLIEGTEGIHKRARLPGAGGTVTITELFEGSGTTAEPLTLEPTEITGASTRIKVEAGAVLKLGVVKLKLMKFEGPNAPFSMTQPSINTFGSATGVLFPEEEFLRFPASLSSSVY